MARGWNPDYLAAQAELEAGQEKIIQGRSLLLPKAELSLYARQNKPIFSGRENSSVYDNQITINQPLFDIRKWIGYQKGQLASQLAQTEFDLSQQSLLFQIIEAYFDILLAKDMLAATVASKHAYAHQRDQAIRAFELGNATQIDVSEAQASYDTAAAKEISDQNTLELKQQHLSRLTGLESNKINQIQSVKDPLLLSFYTPQRSLQEWQGIAATHSPRLKGMMLSLGIATQNVTEKRGEHWPVISFTAAYTHPRREELNHHQPTIGIGVTLPLFSGGGLQSSVREAISKEEVTRQQLLSAKQHTEEEVRKAFLGVSYGEVLIRARQTMVNSAKYKVESTRRGSELGLRTRLDLLLAEQAYYDALSSFSLAKYQYLLAYAQLTRLTGTLDEALLADINQLLKP